jgi:hypothetical protein
VGLRFLKAFLVFLNIGRPEDDGLDIERYLGACKNLNFGF